MSELLIKRVKSRGPEKGWNLEGTGDWGGLAGGRCAFGVWGGSGEEGSRRAPGANEEGTGKGGRIEARELGYTVSLDVGRKIRSGGGALVLSGY